MQRTLFLPLFLALAPACASMTSASADTVAENRAGFERLKSLAGDWSGPGGEGAEMAVVEVRYRVTAGGTAVEETIMPGTPHEMITMYHMDRDRLMLTHYCTAGNQPSMVAVPGESKISKDGEVRTLRFVFEHGTNMPDANVGHMHEAQINFTGKDELSSTWTYWSEGKPGHQANFHLTRKAKA